MIVRMAKLTRTRTGRWTARKVIPADVREAYGKREDKPTWPASLTPGQARAEFGAWLLAIEERIAALRSTGYFSSPGIALSQRQSRALAGKWYNELVQRFEDEPGDAEGWEIELEKLYPEPTDDDYQRSNQVPYEGPWVPTKFVRGELDVLLDEQRMRLTKPAEDRLIQDMADVYLAFCHLMIRRANGDYGKDHLPAHLPEWRPQAQPVVSASDGLSISDIFEGYVAERKPAAATVKAWKRMTNHLALFLEGKPATDVTPEDIVAWKDRLLTEPTKSGKPKSAKTVRETYLAAAKTVFSWAKENRKVQQDPTSGVRVRSEKTQRLRDPGFTNDEALMILRGTLAFSHAQLSEKQAGARRWVPWVCAYTGARVNEITQLRKQDVFERDGIWVANVTPEAGSVKNNMARLVPLHSHLIEQGFVNFVEEAEDGPLFYEPKAYRGGSAGNPQYKKVGERLASWVRSLGVTDKNVMPNHGWRHRFKTSGREAGMDPEAREAIPGHAPATEGQRYGGWSLVALSREVERLPRFEV